MDIPSLLISKKDSFADELEPVPVPVVGASSYTDLLNKTYPIDTKLKNDKYFGEFYTKWWIPKAHGLYGDWRYSHPPINFE